MMKRIFSISGFFLGLRKPQTPNRLGFRTCPWALQKSWMPGSFAQGDFGGPIGGWVDGLVPVRLEVKVQSLLVTVRRARGSE